LPYQFKNYLTWMTHIFLDAHPDIKLDIKQKIANLKDTEQEIAVRKYIKNLIYSKVENASLAYNLMPFSETGIAYGQIVDWLLGNHNLELPDEDLLSQGFKNLKQASRYLRFWERHKEGIKACPETNYLTISAINYMNFSLECLQEAQKNVKSKPNRYKRDYKKI